MQKRLFIGITSWNSELFLDACLTSINNTTQGISTRVVVFDNASDDKSCDVAAAHNVECVIKRTTQAEAMNYLLSMSDAEYTLLIHADTVLLSKNWFDYCSSLSNNETVLVSPEDIGCGPMTRSFGKDMPESSFLFFNTHHAKKLMTWRVIKSWRKVPLKFGKRLDFYGGHITHNLPALIQRAGYTWHPMTVLHSNVLQETQYRPQKHSNNWTELLGKLEYGLGNFYSINGEITHYHNWYDRISSRPYDKNNPTTQKNNDGFEVDYIHQYSMRFIEDFQNNKINLPVNK